MDDADALRFHSHSQLRSQSGQLQENATGKLLPSAEGLGILLAAALVLLPVGLYRHTHIEMLRAESGIYLIQSALGSKALVNRAGFFFSHAPNGHYTPLAFSAELLCSYLFGVNEALWLYRQLFLLAVLGLILFATFVRLSGLRHSGIVETVSMAVVFPVIFLSMPLMIDFVAWPFMSLQIAFMICAASSLLLCREVYRRGDALAGFSMGFGGVCLRVVKLPGHWHRGHSRDCALAGFDVAHRIPDGQQVSGR